MSKVEPLTAREIVEIIFQEPQRVTKDLFAGYYKPENRSYGRAVDELVECERLSDIQLDQILHAVDVLTPRIVRDYMLREYNKVSHPEGSLAMVWLEIEKDQTAFLGLCVSYDEQFRPMRIAEGNPVAQEIKGALLSYLEFYFPRLSYLHPENCEGFEVDAP